MSNKSNDNPAIWLDESKESLPAISVSKSVKAGGDISSVVITILNV